MSKIEVGEYIRTKSGKIYKIDKIKKCGGCRKPLYINIEKIKGLKFTNSYHAKDIKAHSKNIIDLIEVGDYVNGIEVIEAVNEKFMGEQLLKNADIKTIVTKEQFNSVMYKVGG